MSHFGKLYIVATPIGNLKDISLRALEVLRQVDQILAEDTRHAMRLLDHYQINKKCVSLHNFNEGAQCEKIIASLALGHSFALVSDAGTPLISDPGWLLVNRARKAGIEVLAIPGPCALIAALSISGLSTQPFHFFGFLPTKSSQRQQVLKNIVSYSGTLVFYESPHRLRDMLTDCQQVLGESCVYAVAKELTKVFETLRSGSVGEILAWLHEKPEHGKGEFVVMVEKPAENDVKPTAAAEALLVSLLKHMPLKTAIAIVLEHYDVNKNVLYEKGLQLKS